jgi:hypothetical protein
MRRFNLVNFVAFYRGQTVLDAELVAVSAEPRLVRCLFAELLGEPLKENKENNAYRNRTAILEVMRDE